MRLKRYTAPTMADALKIIKHELGPEAVILSTRKIKGTDGKPSLEITAAVDRDNTPPAPAPKNTPGNNMLDMATEAANATKPGPQPMTELGARLLEHGLSSAVASRISKAVSALEDTGFSTEDGLEMVLTKMLTFSRPEDVLPHHRPVLLIGPTGAGKTTTLAKLAVSGRMQGRQVGLVTLDTYKIGGVEQLTIYAEALKEHLQIISAQHTLRETLASLAEKDLVLIDSAGINPFEPSRLNDLAQHLQDIDVHVVLVLPSNLNSAELRQLPRAFAALKPSQLIVSKLDETVHLGGILNAAIENNLPVCFATDGQQVPQDLLLLDAASLARRLLSPPRLPWEETGT